MARRLVQKHGLTPPIDVLALVQQYAEVILRPIPIAGVDGVSIDIKVPGKKPKVVVNNSVSSTRQLFTLAHELGHLIIPWHVGTLPDILSVSFDSLRGLTLEARRKFLEPLSKYSVMEEEANRFASELLMPEQWVLDHIAANDNLAQLHETICRDSKVSPWAACIRLRSLLPPGIVYCCVESDVNVSFGGSSDGTHQSPPYKGEFNLSNAFARASAHYAWQSGYNTYHWWRFPTEVKLEDSEPRDWRVLLADIVNEVAPPGSDTTKIQHVINSVISAAHNSVLRNKSLPYTEEAIIAACLNSIDNRNDLMNFGYHPEFDMVIKKRAAELYTKRQNRLSKQ
jgi:hypothetical protein